MLLHTLSRELPIFFKLSTVTIRNALEFSRGKPMEEDSFWITFHGTTKNISAPLNKDSFDNLITEILLDLPMGLVRFENLNSYSPVTSYFVFAVSDLRYKQAKRISDVWSARAWLPLKSSAYLQGFPNLKEDPGIENLPYDQKTGEFIFFGADFCEPCTKIATFLLHAKIKFVEVVKDGKVPLLWYKGKQIYGKDDILAAIQEMYAIPPAKVEEFKRKLK